MFKWTILLIILCVACNRNHSLVPTAIETYYFDHKLTPNTTYLLEYKSIVYGDYIFNMEENDGIDTLLFPTSGQNRVGKTFQYKIKTGSSHGDTLTLTLNSQIIDIDMQGSMFDNIDFNDNNNDYNQIKNSELKATYFGHIINQEEFILDSISPPSAELNKGVVGAIKYWKLQDGFPKGPLMVGDTFTSIPDKLNKDYTNQSKVRYILRRVSDNIGYFDGISESNFSKNGMTYTKKGTRKLEYNFTKNIYQNKHSIANSEMTTKSTYASSINNTELIDTLTISVIK